jgi:hypothetical protein
MMGAKQALTENAPKSLPCASVCHGSSGIGQTE